MNTFTLLSLVEIISVEKVYGWVSFGFSAIAVLAGLIVVHEFGHYIVGRWMGARIEKFSIGFGKTLFSTKKGDTEYMLALIPLGGYVKFYGDDPEVEVENKEDSFFNLEVWRRLLIVGAGPVFNIVLALIIVTMAAMLGLPEGTTIIDQVVADSPAQKAGMMAGDKVVAIDDKPITKWNELVSIIRDAPEKQLNIEILREPNESLTLEVTPYSHKVKTVDGKEITIGQIGVTSRQVTHSYSPPEALVKGAEWTWNVFKLTLWGISKLLTREIAADQIAGPIGIMQMAGSAADSGIVNLMLFIGLISINLGILNLLPIPVLDGGHIVFFTMEAIIGRPVKLRTQEIAQQVGVFMLISLMALAFYNDIARLITG